MTTIVSPYFAENPPQPVWQLLNTARRERDRSWKRLEDACLHGRPGPMRRLKHSWYQDHLVKTAYLHRSGIRHPNVSAWDAEARMFEPLEPGEHIIEWWREPKRGGFRIVCDLAPSLKAVHAMTADLIRAQMQVPNFVFNLSSKSLRDRLNGREGVVATIVERLSNGFAHYRIYDVKDCFSSVNPETLSYLPIPRRIYENTLNLRNLHFRHDPNRERKHFKDASFCEAINHATEAGGPTGLMQGSPASNVILAFLLQDMPQPDPRDGCLLLYGDDLIFLARTRSFIDRVDQATVQFFGQPSLGPLQLLEKASGYQDYFEYLGYGFDYSSVSDRWEVWLSHKNWTKLERLRDEEALRHGSRDVIGGTLSAARKIKRSLDGHRSLTNSASIFRSVMAGGLDAAEM